MTTQKHSTLEAQADAQQTRCDFALDALVGRLAALAGDHPEVPGLLRAIDKAAGELATAAAVGVYARLMGAGGLERIVRDAAMPGVMDPVIPFDLAADTTLPPRE